MTEDLAQALKTVQFEKLSDSVQEYLSRATISGNQEKIRSIRDRNIKIPVADIELPSIEEFQANYLTDDCIKAKVYAVNILNKFQETHCLHCTQNIPLRLYLNLLDLLKPYGITTKKVTAITSDEILLEFVMNPNKLPIFKQE